MRSGATTAFACAVLLVGCFQTTGDGTELGDMETPTDRGRSPAGRCSLPSAPDATIVAPLAAQARPSCAPDDGPAWSFEILQVPRTFSCEPLTDTRVRLEVFDELRGSTLPRTFEVGSGFGMNDGAAFLCEGSDCEPTVG